MVLRIWLTTLVLGFSTILGVWSCTTPKTSQTAKLKAKLDKKQKQKVDEYRAEIEIGRSMSGRLLAFYGVIDDPTLIGYLNQVGTYVASYSEYPDRRYMFQILDNKSVNAFACPGGYILVTSGAIKAAKNEAELAHILGHEVAHVGEKHMFDALKGMSKDDMEKAAKEADKASMRLSEELKVRRRPVPVENDTGALLAKYLSGASAGLSILSAAKAGMSLILEKGLGADLEYKADEEGTKYAVNAGYEPKALMNYLCRIEQKKRKIKGRCKLSNILKKKRKKRKSIMDKTHPPVGERIANITKTLEAIGSLDSIGARGSARFVKYKKRITN